MQPGDVAEVLARNLAARLRQHLGREIDAGDGEVAAIAGEREPGAHADLEHPALPPVDDLHGVLASGLGHESEREIIDWRPAAIGMTHGIDIHNRDLVCHFPSPTSKRVFGASLRYGRKRFPGPAPCRSCREALFGHIILSRGGLDPAAAENPFATVTSGIRNASLPGRHALLAMGELDRDAILVASKPRWLQRSARADAREHVLASRRRLLQGLVAKPVHFAQPETPRPQRLARTDYHFARGGVELQHVERLARGDPDALPLADRVIDDAAV